MKYIKVIIGLGLIPLGVFVGSYITVLMLRNEYLCVLVIGKRFYKHT